MLKKTNYASIDDARLLIDPHYGEAERQIAWRRDHIGRLAAIVEKATLDRHTIQASTLENLKRTFNHYRDIRIKSGDVAAFPDECQRLFCAIDAFLLAVKPQ